MQDHHIDYVEYNVMLHINNDQEELEYGTLLLALQVIGKFFMEIEVNRCTFSIYEKGTTHVLGFGDIDLPFGSGTNTTSSSYTHDTIAAVPDMTSR